MIDGALPKVTIYVQVAIPPAGEGTGQRGNGASTKPVKKSASRVHGGGDAVSTGGGWTGRHGTSHFVPVSEPDNLADVEAAHAQAAGQAWVEDVVETTHDRRVGRRCAVRSGRRRGRNNCGCRGRIDGDGVGRRHAGFGRTIRYVEPIF